MKPGKQGLVLVIAFIIAITAALPIAEASTVSVVIDTETGSANVTAYSYATAVITSNQSTLIYYLSNLLNNTSGTYSKVLYLNDSVFSDIQSSIEVGSPSANISYLSINASRTVSVQNSNQFLITQAVKLVMNISGIYHDGAYDLGWRSFSDNSSLSLNNVNYNQIVIGDMEVGYYSLLNFSAFSKSLTDWNRTYDSANNTTTFSLNAGYTLNYTGNITLPEGYFNITLQSDPSYSIVTPGYAVAAQDSIQITNPPASTNPLIYYGGVVAIVVIGSVIYLYTRRNR